MPSMRPYWFLAVSTQGLSNTDLVEQDASHHRFLASSSGSGQRGSDFPLGARPKVRRAEEEEKAARKAAKKAAKEEKRKREQEKAEEEEREAREEKNRRMEWKKIRRQARDQMDNARLLYDFLKERSNYERNARPRESLETLLRRDAPTRLPGTTGMNLLGGLSPSAAHWFSQMILLRHTTGPQMTQGLTPAGVFLPHNEGGQELSHPQVPPYYFLMAMWESVQRTFDGSKSAIELSGGREYYARREYFVFSYALPRGGGPIRLFPANWFIPHDAQDTGHSFNVISATSGPNMEYVFLSKTYVPGTEPWRGIQVELVGEWGRQARWMFAARVAIEFAENPGPDEFEIDIIYYKIALWGHLEAILISALSWVQFRIAGGSRSFYARKLGVSCKIWKLLGFYGNVDKYWKKHPDHEDEIELVPPEKNQELLCLLTALARAAVYLDFHTVSGIRGSGYGVYQRYMEPVSGTDGDELQMPLHRFIQMIEGFRARGEEYRLVSDFWNRILVLHAGAEWLISQGEPDEANLDQGEEESPDL